MHRWPVPLAAVPQPWNWDGRWPERCQRRAALHRRLGRSGLVRRRQPWVRPLREIEWFDKSRVASAFYLLSLTLFWLSIPAAVVAGNMFHLDRLATACVVLCAVSTWSPTDEAADKSRWDFGHRNSRLNTRYFLWLMIGGGCRRAIRNLTRKAGHA